MKGLAFVLLAILAQATAIQFYLEVNTVKCLKEEVQANVLVTGEYIVMEMPNVKDEFVIRDSKGHILSMKHDIPHSRWFKFSFVTETYDTFEICFSSQASPSLYSNNAKQGISLDVKRGIEAKSYEGIGEVANLKPVEIELKRLEDLSEAIVQDFARMRKNEEEMRDTNETTNARVLYLSVFSMCCLLLLSTWQVFYLRRFFKSKKLIE